LNSDLLSYEGPLTPAVVSDIKTHIVWLKKLYITTAYSLLPWLLTHNIQVSEVKAVKNIDQPLIR